MIVNTLRSITDLVDYDLKKWPNNEYSFTTYEDNTGYQCSIKRNIAGVWCGYVTLPESHPYYTSNKDDLKHIISVHGKLSYSNSGTFGFDCACKNDYVPKNPKSNCKYWTAEMVKKEVINMAQQFEELADIYS